MFLEWSEVAVVRGENVWQNMLLSILAIGQHCSGWVILSIDSRGGVYRMFAQRWGKVAEKDRSPCVWEKWRWSCGDIRYWNWGWAAVYTFVRGSVMTISDSRQGQGGSHPAAGGM